MSKGIAIITARGGSKRIPRKNIKDFLGKPIISYVIETAKNCGLFSKILVSTDDEKIANISRSFGAVVPFFRSKKNSDDHATTSDVLLEVLSELRSASNAVPDVACCIYPTAVFTTVDLLNEAHTKLEKSKVDLVFACAKFPSPILRSLKINDDQTLSYAFPEYENARSQDLTTFCYDAGQFYFFNVPKFLERKTLMSKHARGIFLLESQVHDIDTPDDWAMAELKYKYLTKRS